MILMVKALNTPLKCSTKKLILLKLADNANDEGICWPSYQHIADQCELSKRTVMRHIKGLEEMGVLSVNKRRQSSNQNHSNLYKLNLFDSDNISPRGSDKMSLGGDNVSLGGSDKMSPRTSHSLEPVKEPIKRKQKKLPEIEKPDNVSDQVWCDFNSQRRLKITQTALNGIIKQANAAGWTLEQALTEAVERGWQSFKADWVNKPRYQQENKSLTDIIDGWHE